MGDRPTDIVTRTDPAVQVLPPATDVPDEARSKQERILDAALDLFAGQGYHVTAVPEIAKAAGVATGTIYRYFDTKDVLLNALYQRWKGAFNAHVLAAAADNLSSRERFGVLWTRIADWLRDYPVQAVFLDQHFHKPVLDEKSREADRAFVQLLAQFASDAVAAGEVRAMPPMLVAALVWGAALGMSKLAVDGHLVVDDAVASQAEASLWDAIKA